MAMKNDTKFQEELTCHFKLTWRNWGILIRALESLKKFRFNGLLLSKVYFFWAKKSTEKLSFMKLNRNTKFGEESTCRFKIGRRSLTNFDLSTRKSRKILSLMGSFWAKYILFELKKDRGVIFHDVKEWCKIWSKTNLLLGKWNEQFGKFSPEHSKVPKLELWWDPFVQSRKYMGLKYTLELCVMKMKNDTEIGGKLACRFTMTWGTSQILTWALESLKSFCFNWLLVTKVYIAWVTKVQRSYLSWHWRVMPILKKKWLVVWKKTWEIW